MSNSYYKDLLSDVKITNNKTESQDLYDRMLLYLRSKYTEPRIASDLLKLETYISASGTSSAVGSVIFGGQFIYPVRNAVMTSPYGMRTLNGVTRLHTGVDFGHPVGTPILASAAGKVKTAAMLSGYGKTIIIVHDSKYTTLYGHCSKLNVVPGQPVSQGQIIGEVGSTGLSTGPHLHFEIRVNESPVDPTPLLVKKDINISTTLVESVTALTGSSVTVGGGTISIVRNNTQTFKNLGPVERLVNHWTAGAFTTAYNEYHFNICFVNNKAVVVKTLSTQQLGKHTLGRNPNMLGISLACMSKPNSKSTHPQPAQIEAMAILLAELCVVHNLNPAGVVTLPKKTLSGDVLVETGGTRTFNVIADHAEYSKADGYAADRWDIGAYQETVKAKTFQYHSELKQGRRSFQFSSITSD